mmetsp:Transcript_45129/g.116744  ORF Transcript_45129/g.116744 Transcript_45129/m.116744 type:complete len:425 (-) Transcript_45129:207-1481(-)
MLSRFARSFGAIAFRPFSTTSKVLATGMTKFPGARTQFVPDMEFRESFDPIGCYRVTDHEGMPRENVNIPETNDEEFCKRVYDKMTQLNVMDTVFYDAQRQGRISFYMTHFGEEAAVIGSAAAFEQEHDHVFAQYREAGVLLWRGWTIKNCADQCTSNEFDQCKGRQMPVHYGDKNINFQTVSSPLGTQLPQAVGAAYALKRSDSNGCAVVYFGEGAASEGDAHAAMNFASTLKVPIVFFCRNNGYAISTPSKEQYSGDGIAIRGIAYGMKSIRVDGNDFWSVYQATREARRMAVENNEPVLIEAMTYRGGHHSTSDDSTAYRTEDEIKEWTAELENPIGRFRAFLRQKGWFDEEADKTKATALKKEIRSTLGASERAKKPAVSELFTDVYDKKTWILEEQEKELHAHLEKYGSNYGLEKFSQA